MIVVDTNIICYLYLAGEFTPQAEQALMKDSQWAAPVLWRSEFRNVLAGYLRKKILTLQQAQQIMEEAIRVMKGREYEVASYQVLNLVEASPSSAYDCEFVALAKDLNVALVTVDRQLLRQFPDTAQSLEQYISAG